MGKISWITACALVLIGCVRGAEPQAAAPSAYGSAAACRAETAVEWRLPDRHAERAALDPWCAAVGAPVVHGAGGHAVMDSVVVVTWNVHVGGGDVRRFVGRLRAGELTGGAPVEHFVLLLQEAHRAGDAVPAAATSARTAPAIRTRQPDGNRESIEVVARELGLSLAYVPSMRNGGIAEDRGNAILATQPLRDVVALELPPVRQRRVAIAAILSAQGPDGMHRELQVVSVHLENRPATGVTGVRQRGEQMEWLLRSLPPARYSVLGGDLNTWTAGAREPAVTLTARHYPDNGARDAAPTHVLPLLPDLRLDYLFARLPDGGGLTGRLRVDDRHGSDHHPVLAWVHLP